MYKKQTGTQLIIDTALQTFKRGIFATRKSPVKGPCRPIRGFGLVEMVVGAAILSVSLLGIARLFQATDRASNQTKFSIQGGYLLEEGVEIVKLLRDDGYTSNILGASTSTPHFFLWNGTDWVTTATNTFVDGLYERKFTSTDVKRDVNSDIATVGTYDPDIKLVTVSVAWREPLGTTTRSIQTYVTNIFNN